MSDVVYTSNVRIERVKGPVRLAYLPGESQPVTFSIHGAIAEHYKVNPAALGSSHASTIDYVIAATAGWMMGTFGGALEARKIDAGNGRLTADVIGEVEMDEVVLVIRRIHVALRLTALEQVRETVERVHGVRKGFRVTTLEGASEVLAHVDFAGPVRVGKYGVDVPAFERLALPALRDAMSRKQIAVIDEIGKMELASSPRFCDLVREVLDSPSIVLATVMEKPHPFADEIKRRGDAEVLEVTTENRSALPGKMCEMIRIDQVCRSKRK